MSKFGTWPLFSMLIGLLLAACAGLPNAQFSVSASTGPAPLTVQFINLSDNAESVQWDFGDGTTSTELEPSHTYTKAGTHTITLTAISEGEPAETDVATQSVTVEPGPLARLAINTLQAALSPGEEYAFTIDVLGKFDNAISGLPFVFRADESAGRIGEQGLFTAGTKAGAYQDAVTVEVTQGSITRRATTDVVTEPDSLDRVEIIPITATLPPTGQQQLAARAMDQFGNFIPDLVYDFRSDEQAGQVDSNGWLTAGRKAGKYESAVTVVVTQGSVSATAAANVIIEPGPLHHVELEPTRASVEVRKVRRFTATAFDQFENPIPDLTYSFRSTEEAGQVAETSVLGPGMFAAVMKAGVYEGAITVEVTQGSLVESATASVEVTPGPLDKILLSPELVNVFPGKQEQFQATAFDVFGNEIRGLLFSWEAADAGGIAADGLFTAGSTPGEYIDAITATAVEDKRDKREVIAAASVQIPFSAFGTATIDGVWSPGEWHNAAQLDFVVNLPFPGGGTAPAKLFVMNDNSNLYLALRFRRERLDPGNTLFFEFDGDLDGQVEVGDDAILVNGPGSFFDNSKQCPRCGGQRDVDDGGTTDGRGTIFNDGIDTVYEMSHPLDSPDDEHDFSLDSGDCTGFSLFLRILAGGYLRDTPFPWGGFMVICLA